MLSYTVKSVVKHAQMFSNDRTIFIHMEDPKTGNRYKFQIDKESIVLKVKKGILNALSIVEEVEMIKLPERLNVISMTEVKYTRDGEIFEENTINVKYEAQVFVRLFRMMKERVYFTIRSGNKIYDCYYIDGKVFYIDETEDEYRVMGSDLFKLPVVFKNYGILTISGILDKVDFGSFMREQEAIANILGKKFLKYRYGQLV